LLLVRQLALRAVYDTIKASGELSLGLDDFLMAMADAHDTNRYLLRQRTAGTGSAAGATSARKKKCRAEVSTNS
jgi:hypothetical protein